jgi:hypothetical protein
MHKNIFTVDACANAEPESLGRLERDYTQSALQKTGCALA